MRQKRVCSVSLSQRIRAESRTETAGEIWERIYRNKKWLLVFLVPAFLMMAVFLHYPFFVNILNSFQKIGGLAAPSKGYLTPWYSNYIEMLHDKNMWIALKNTLILMGCTLIFQVGIALVLAILVDQIKAGAKFFRVVYFFPIVVSANCIRFFI